MRKTPNSLYSCGNPRCHVWPCSGAVHRPMTVREILMQAQRRARRALAEAKRSRRG